MGLLPVTYLETYSDGLQLLIQATSSALSDKEFDLPTERVQKARLCAEKFLVWAKTHQTEAQSFATTVTFHLVISKLGHHSVPWAPLLYRIREPCFEDIRK